jgi:hypothetical protein
MMMMLLGSWKLAPAGALGSQVAVGVQLLNEPSTLLIVQRSTNEPPSLVTYIWVPPFTTVSPSGAKKVVLVPPAVYVGVQALSVPFVALT